MAIFHEHDTIGYDEMQCLIRVARDSIPRQRLEIARALADADEYLDSTKVGEVSNTPTQTAKETLEELWMLKLIDRQGTNTFEWLLNDNTRSLITQSCILEEG